MSAEVLPLFHYQKECRRCGVLKEQEEFGKDISSQTNFILIAESAGRNILKSGGKRTTSAQGKRGVRESGIRVSSGKLT
jgi:hypothetical protein